MRSETWAAGYNNIIVYFTVAASATEITIKERPNGSPVVLPADAVYGEIEMRIRHFLASRDRVDPDSVTVWLNLA